MRLKAQKLDRDALGLRLAVGTGAILFTAPLTGSHAARVPGRLRLDHLNERKKYYFLCLVSTKSDLQVNLHLTVHLCQTFAQQLKLFLILLILLLHVQQVSLGLGQHQVFKHFSRPTSFCEAELESLFALRCRPSARSFADPILSSFWVRLSDTVLNLEFRA